MGNQLAGAGSVAANVDLNNVNSKLSTVAPLGRRRGRLFTSVHGRYPEERRDVVVRVFLRAYGDAEQSAAVADQERHFAAIDARLRAAHASKADDGVRTPKPMHLIHYTTTKVTERAVYLERPFIAHTLSERLRMRPFLSESRRLFLVYQLFHAVHDLHNVYGVSHGDLKHENVLLSTAGWLYVTDLAPYKPARVESDNPANFEFYFDNSETRVCTLAPERFTDEHVDGVTPARPPRSPGAEQTKTPDGAGTPTPAAGGKSPRGQPSAGASPAVTRADGSLRPVAEKSEVFAAACIASLILSDETLFKLSNVLELRNKATVQERRSYVYEALAQYPIIRPVARDFIVDAMVGLADVDGEAPTAADDAQRLNALEALDRHRGTLFPSFFAMMHNNVLPTLMALSPDVLVHFLWSRLYDIVDSAVRCEWDGAFAAGMGRTFDQARKASAAEPSSPTLEDEPEDADDLISEERRLQVQEDVIDLVAPILVGNIRFILLEDNLVKGFGVLERMAEVAGEACRRDVLLPVTVNLTQSSKNGVTPSARAAALRALAAICDSLQTLPAAEGFLFEDFVIPSVVQAAKIGATLKSNVIGCALAETVPVILSSALRILEMRQGTKGSRARLDYDSQREYVVQRCWEAFKPLLNNLSSTSSIIITALKQTKTLLPSLGVELVSDAFVSMLTQLLGSPAVEVKRGMYASLLEVALFLRHSVANASGMIALMLDESLREKDARCIAIGLDAIRIILEAGVLESIDLVHLVESATSLLAHPSAWVNRAAARLFACAARILDPVDVLVRITPAVQNLLEYEVPLALLDQVDPAIVVTKAAKHAHAGERRRLQCCADYLRTYTNPGRVTVPPAVTLRQLDNVKCVSAVDLPRSEIAWLVRSMGLSDAASLAAHGRAKLQVRFLANAPSLPWHMMQFSPTPRQLKRVLWQYKLHKRSVAASAKSKLRRGLQLKERPTPAASPTGGKSDLASVVAAAFKVRHGAKPSGVPLSTVERAHDGGITCMTTARGWIVTSGQDNAVKLWDAADNLKTTSAKVLCPQVHRNVFDENLEDPSGCGRTLFVRFASDDPQSLLALGNSHGQMRLFDIGASKNALMKVTVDGGNAGGLSCAAPLDAKIMVVGSHRGGVYAVDSRTPSREVWLSHVPRNRGPISCMTTVDPQAPFGIACGTLRGYVAIFDMRFRAQMASAALPQAPAIYDICSVVSGAESTAPSIAVATSHLDVLRINASTMQETMCFKPASANSVRCLCSSDGGRSLFSGGSDGLLRHWHLAHPEQSRSIPPPPGRTFDYNYSRGANVVAESPPLTSAAISAGSLTASEQQRRLADAADVNHRDSVTAMACATGSGGQHFLVSGSRDGALVIWRNSVSRPNAPASPTSP